MGKRNVSKKGSPVGVSSYDGKDLLNGCVLVELLCFCRMGVFYLGVKE